MIDRWWNWATDRPIAIYILIFVLSTGLVVLVSFPDYSQEFWYNVKVEAHGMLFDILVLGLLFSFLHSRGEKRRLIQRYINEIDDFRGWNSDEAARRIRGNILRLNSEGIHKIDLSNCCLKGTNLDGANLKRSDLRNANLEGASLSGTNLEKAFLVEANLEGASLLSTILENAFLVKANLKKASFFGTSLKGASVFRANLEGSRFFFTEFAGAYLAEVDLRGAVGLGVSDICKAKTLNGAKFDSDLERMVSINCPQLLADESNPRKWGKADE